MFTISMRKVALFAVGVLATLSLFVFKPWHHASQPVVANSEPQAIIHSERVIAGSFQARLSEIIARAEAATGKGRVSIFGETKIVPDKSQNAPPQSFTINAQR